jgi:hypothetical protein
MATANMPRMRSGARTPWRSYSRSTVSVSQCVWYRTPSAVSACIWAGWLYTSPL